MTKRWFGCRSLRLAGWACLLGGLIPCAWAAAPVDVFRFRTAGVGDRLTNRFLLRNSGTGPIMAQSATPSCDCIQVLQWPTNVEAGATGVVEILFVPDKVGEVDYRVYVTTSDPDPPGIEFAIQGVVTSAPMAKVERDWTLYLGPEAAGKVVENPDGVTWVDVRSAEAYGRSRIPGSLQIPLYAVKTKGFLRNQRVVMVDEGYGSFALEEECRKLRELGFSDLSIWYGGLNAWRQLGGKLDGDGELGIYRVPPIALHDIAYSADWLVVDIDGDATNGVEESVAIPFDASMKERFVSALNSAIEARPQTASVLIATDTGENYGAIAETAGKVNAFVFYLEGGWAAGQVHQQMMGAARHSRTVISQGARTAGGGTTRSGGCGGCPH